MLRVLVLVSGGGTNLQAIIDAVDAGKITNTSLVGVISNNKTVKSLERAKNAGIEKTILVATGQISKDELSKTSPYAVFDLSEIEIK